MNRKNSEALYAEAQQYFPGGVNSPVRAFKSVGGVPLFIDKGDGCRIWDADGNEFIDFCCSWGPLILGHNHPAVREGVIAAVNNGTSFGTPTRLSNELGKLIVDNHNYIEKIRFVSSGTEAVMSALRLARGYTNRDKIVKFDGCYHGHTDALLVKAGSGLATLGTSSSAGVPDSFAKETIVLPLNDRKAVEEAVQHYKGDIACIVIEPIPANNGLLLQGKEFLQFLREICTAEGILLFFDEVISGFRIGFEGAAGYYDIQPDLLTFGKIIGGGMPVGAYAASSEIMGHIAPDGPVYQAGTLSGNPVAMAAGAAQLRECLKPGFYGALQTKTEGFVKTILNHANAKNYSFNIFSVGSIFWMAFSDAKEIVAADQIDAGSMDHFKILHGELLERGVYVGPSGYEVGFVSEAHTEADLASAAQAFCDSLDVVFG
jgi:glutamate-1-semialdehyde 2,1-aminomutase